MRRVHRQRQKKYSPGMTYRRLTHPQKNKIIQKNLLQEIMQETRTEREKIRLAKKNSAKNMMADPTVDIKNQITRMCSMEKILKMRRFQSRRLSGRWERLRYAVRS